MVAELSPVPDFVRRLEACACGTMRRRGSSCVVCEARRIPRVVNLNPDQPRRLYADRYARVWQMVELIAARPGYTRGDLSDKFTMAERQVQADLNIIRTEFGLPLARVQGYRFVTEGYIPCASELTQADALLFLSLLRDGIGATRLQPERRDALLEKLPAAWPPHLVPLMTMVASALSGRPTGEQRIFLNTADAIVRGAAIRLGYRLTDTAIPVRIDGPTVVVEPSLLLRILGRWYVHAESRDVGYARLWPLWSAVSAEAIEGTDGRE